MQRLTAADVESAVFSKAKKGYAPAEVDAFLDRVVATLTAYEQEGRQQGGGVQPAPVAAGALASDRSEHGRTLEATRGVGAQPTERQLSPGWYPDPWQKAQWRYHDGNNWTAHTQ
jgi:DivIVA domain-containing protein